MNLKTRVRSTFMRRLSSVAQLEKQRAKARKKRLKQAGAPTVHYFHQVDDPYSHLAVQKLNELRARYRVGFRPHLTSMPAAEYQGSAEHFATWAWRDAKSIAADYNTTFNPQTEKLSEENIQAANQNLAEHLNRDDFGEIAGQVGEALWNGNTIEVTDASIEVGDLIREGNKTRLKLGHYQGAMFYFEGEWFWGVDRIRALEERLSEEGYDKSPGALCVPEPELALDNDKASDDILFEYFPSLRSPYTAIGHQRVLELVARTGVQTVVRPVMPMLMRGIPAPREKRRYIICDAGREGRAHGAPLGRVVDPFGDPVRRAFALFPAADALGKGMDFVTAYLNAAWFEGIDITGESGLRQVVESAGLDWQQLSEASESEDWQAILEDNLQALTEESLWGVPSFRVSGGRSAGSFACWGQDRIWRVAKEIATRTK